MPLKSVARRAYRTALAAVRACKRKILIARGSTWDAQVGLWYQTTFGHRVYLKVRSDLIDDSYVREVCERVYFEHYLPIDGDVVVDVGAGYGHEAVYLANSNINASYIGFEVQPSVYECLANTFESIKLENFTASPFAISDSSHMKVSSLGDYSSVSHLRNGYIDVPTMTWPAAKDRYSIGEVDLLKVNIEGGERWLLPSLGSMCDIKRVIISAHDFRADRGEGEHFRTREFVVHYLQSCGYQTVCLGQPGDFLENWIFACRL